MYQPITRATKTTAVQSPQIQVEELFEKRFAARPTIVVSAPGRVNLIGEHTDYNDGFVLPMAIERYVNIAGRIRSDSARATARIYSQEMDDSLEIPLDSRPLRGDARWANYVAGVIAGFWDRGNALPSLDVAITSSVPLGSGLSSSAALEVAVATLLETALGISLEPVAKAKLCQRAEHEFALVPCGLMDQLASVLGRSSGAILIDCRDQSTKLIRLAASEVSILICNSNVRHSLADGEYGKRRESCQKAAELLGVAQLRDSTEESVRTAQDKLGSLHFRRALHVVTENARALSFATALEQRDYCLAGKLMYQSHASLQRDYEVSCPELDVLVAAAKDIGVAGGVFGSRMTGGGFGGCTVSLVDTRMVDSIAGKLSEQNQRETGRKLDAFVTGPSEGCVLRRP